MSDNERDAQQSSSGANSDDAGDTGIGISDEELPDDLEPGPDNPLARSPQEAEEAEKRGESSGGGQDPGMPDMGDPGATA